MSLVRSLGEVVGAAFAGRGLDPELGMVVVSSRPDLAQYQCNGALAAAKVSGRNPRELAEDIARDLRSDPRFAAVEVAGPGFLNLSVTDGELARWVAPTASDPRLGIDPVVPQTVVVDYAGPNVAKPMHVGHLRATIIGDSLQRLMGFAGHRVIRDPHFGDWGTQMGMLIVELERRDPSLPYFDGSYTGPYPDESPVSLADLQEMYPEISARCAAEPEWAERARTATAELQAGRPGYRALWQHMVRVSQESQREDFADLGVEFDLWYGESTVHDRIEPMIDRLREAGVVEESQGALIVPVSGPDESRELPPLLLTKSDGAYLYSTTDLATLEMRIDDLGADMVLYVVDARQADHFEQVFRAARLSGIATPSVDLEHVKFGTMNGTDGKPFRTRAGGVVRLRDLIEMVTEAAAARLDAAEAAAGYPPEERREIARKVGLAALKYGDLSTHRTSNYVFDLERFVAFEGKTGPYLQYAAVRIASILRNAADRRIEPGELLPPVVEVERALVLELLRFPEVLQRAVDGRAPNHIAEYAYDVATAFSRFYDTCHILSEEDTARRASWLALVEATRAMLVHLLDLLGIEVPDRM